MSAEQSSPLEGGNLTPWFHASIKPVRQGVYQRDMGATGRGTFSYWDGERWYGWGFTVAIAKNNYAHTPSAVQDAPWRGLAKRP